MFDYKKFIALARMRFNLGLGIIGMFTSIIGMLTFAKVWEETFTFYNIPMISIYLLLPLGFFIACWWMGYIYDVKGIWKEENRHINDKLNPQFQLLWTDIRNINDKIDTIKTQLDEINSKNSR